MNETKFKQGLLIKHPGTSKYLSFQVHFYVGGKGLAKIDYCIPGSRKAELPGSEPLGLKYITANAFPNNCILAIHALISTP